MLQIPSIYEEFLTYFAEQAEPEVVLAFSPSEAAQERAEQLLDKNNAGSLTLDEMIELEQMLYFDRKFSVLKAQAAAKLKKRK